MRFIIIAFLSFTCTVQADIVAHYKIGKETLTLSYRDDQHIRVDRGQLGYSIINGDQAIIVLNQGGGRIVMNVDDIGRMINDLQGSQAPAIPHPSTVSLILTNKFSDVAGIKGRVYTASDARSTFLAVLTDNPSVKEASKGLRLFFRRFAGAMKNERGERLLSLEKSFQDLADSGVLQIEGGLKLLSINKRAQPDAFYTPPPLGIQFPN
ncbi:Uncharacterised protein [Zhongshania aliphaticivorans]|uniref:DUF4412 domain-containing protein n=1 Tax=Zhongshania aliphaticivorans TaxID=1470434 RepID=A0A5S9PGL7_9GAMM|nr:hypothetical protein [Zhongshania aliphaticivorans]CAA0102888.1 Uncharacterised protein [Zhongshania aliphaticivorans]CAA0113847.1 Uncharacterised protein [Zhongshania aliphaticivorans]